MLSKELEFTLNLAFKEAREKRHEFMTVEHLLLALLDNPSAAEVLKSCGADLDKLKQELSTFLGETTPLLPASCSRPIRGASRATATSTRCSVAARAGCRSA